MGRHKTTLAVVVVVLIAAAIYYFFFMPSQPGEISESMPAQEPSIAAPDLETEEIIEPLDVDLNMSDALVRKLAEELSQHPMFSRWLVTNHLIRRFVAAVDLIALGDSPRRPMDFIEIDEPFIAREEEGQVFIDPNSYQRYDRIAGVISSLDAQGCVKLYKQLRLPIRQAYREMGYPDENFDSTLEKAISNILETPVVENRIYIEKDVTTYLMMNPDLENLNSAQKHLLRMGPDNMRVIQSKLREIALLMGFNIQGSSSAD
jgi:hypothetical protein